MMRGILSLLIIGASTWWGSPALALISGSILGMTLGRPCLNDPHRMARNFLQGCVILLGFQMDLIPLLKLGVSGCFSSMVTISLTMLLGIWLGKLLGSGNKTSILISSGTAICGGSAIAAVAPVLDASETEVGAAVGAVFLLNAVALLLFPFLGHHLHLSEYQFGVWSGISIHDVSSVIGAAGSYGEKALGTATAVKLSRMLWIAPLALVLGVVFGKREKKGGFGIPWFLLLFVGASLARSFIPAMSAMAPELRVMTKIMMNTALFLVGTGISMAALRNTGWRAGLLAVTLWLFISAAGLFVARCMG